MASAWRPHEPMSPDAWAERYRVLSDRVSAEPGPMRLDRTPYMRGILQALGGRYTEVVVQASAQSAKSEAGRTWIGWAADLDPGPMMIVFPTEDAAYETMEERVIPMFRDTPRLRRLFTSRAWDVKKSRLVLATCTINVGWAGSPQALASRPERRILLDEINKYPAYKGKEANPLSLARARLTTYAHRGQLYCVSTPTVPEGEITRLLEACVDRRAYHVPCPACGTFAPFDWDNVKWPGMDATDETDLGEQRAQFEAGILHAQYECDSCGNLAADADRWAMVQRGEWVSDGYPRGEHPDALSIGFQIHGLSTPWTSFTAMALKFVAAKIKGIAELQHFYNSDLGLPFWGVQHDRTQLVEIKAETVQRKASIARRDGTNRGLAPAWATHLVAGCDPGKVGVHYVIRAWGQGFRSRLVACGHAESLDALRALVLERQFPREGGGPALTVARLMIDVGGGRGTVSQARTDEVYRWAKISAAVVRPVKGYGGGGQMHQPVATRMHTYRPPGEQSKPYDVTLSVIDTEYFKDLLAGRIESDDESLWEIGCEVPGDYVMQVSAERKGLVERRVDATTGQVREVFRWAPRVVGSPNHYLDCESYAGVGAYMIDMDRVREPGASKPPNYAPKKSGDQGMGGRGDGRWRIGR